MKVIKNIVSIIIVTRPFNRHSTKLQESLWLWQSAQGNSVLTKSNSKGETAKVIEFWCIVSGL